MQERDERTERIVEDSLSWFGLLPSEFRNPHDLGYSERKRFALASVMAMDTSIVVLDEPTAGPDASEIRFLTRALNRRTVQGKNIVVISHDMDFVAEQIPRIICLSCGRKIFDGNAGIFLSMTIF